MRSPLKPGKQHASLTRRILVWIFIIAFWLIYYWWRES